MKTYLILILLNCIFTINCKSQTNSLQFDNWILDNKELEESILNFIDSTDHFKHLNKFVFIQYNVINDSTCSYTLDYCIDIYTLIVWPAQLFFYVKNNLVCLYVAGLDSFKLSEDFLVKIMKAYFPDQYKYHVKNGDYPPPYTSMPIVWKLTFQNNKLITREIIDYVFYIPPEDKIIWIDEEE